MEEKHTMLEETGISEFIDLPFKVNIIGSKWVFKTKKDIAGNVVHYKAYLVV